MLRITAISNIVNTRLLNQVKSSEPVAINGIFSQIVRWKRKPIWLPPAKSKLFKVPPRLRLPDEEAREILRLYNHYRTYRKSIRHYLMALVKVNEVQFDEELLKKAEEKDYLQCWNINEKWNKEVAKLREIRLEEQQNKQKLEVIEKMDEKLQKDIKIMAQIEEKVKKATIEAPNFITQQNIDKAIEEALVNVVNYDAAIDTDGNSYKGRYDSSKKQVYIQH